MTFDEIAMILQSGRTALFLGAGISRQSGIPLVQEIEWEILKVLDITDADSAEYREKKLPFEATMQVVAGHPCGLELLDIFSGTRPQRNHHLIARLATSIIGRIPLIITTNFDALIEKAIALRGGTIEVILDDADLPPTPINSLLPRLVKLHGCITRPAALAVTIKSVANEQGIEGRRLAIQHFLAGGHFDDIIVIGYSFSDRFDITPALNLLRLPVKFWVVNHTLADTIASEPLSSLSEKHPLRHYDGAILSVNTDKLIEEVWKRTQRDAPMPLIYDDMLLSAKLRRWKNAIEAAEGYEIGPLIAAELFKLANCYATSNRYAKTALVRTDPARRPDHAFFSCEVIGNNFRDLHESFAAQKYLRSALKFAHKGRRLDLMARALNSLGMLFEDKAKAMDRAGESDRPHYPRSLAIKYYEKAAEWATKIGNMEDAAKYSGNIGIALKNTTSKASRRLAFTLLRKALKSARRIGDQRSVGRYYGMMASCLSLLGKKKSGIELWKRALQISSDLGDTLHVAIWTANLGEDYLDLDEAEARRHINNAGAMFAELNIVEHFEYCVRLLEKVPSSKFPAS